MSIKPKSTKIFFIFAIVSAIFFLIYSIVQLIGYGFSTGMISESLAKNSLMSFISSNFKSISLTLLIINLIATTIIYFGFIFLSNKTNSKKMKIASYIILIGNLLIFLLSILFYLSPTIFQSFNIKMNTAESIFGVTNIIFGIILLSWKNKVSHLTKALGVLYISQGIILITILFLPVRLADFTIALRVIEAVLFASFIKEKI